MILKGYIFSILYVLLCVFVALVLHKIGVAKKYTRKFVHIFVGFEWVILYKFFGTSLHFLAVCILFTALLFIDYKAKLLPAMSSDGDNAPGTVYYAVAMTVLALASYFEPRFILPFGVSVFCTSLGDGFAAVVGQTLKKRNPRVFGSKTLFGSLSCFLICFAVPLVLAELYNFEIALWQALVLAFFATEIELFVSRGLDNIVLTLSVASLTFALIYLPFINSFLVPILLTPIIIALSYRKRALTVGGIILAVVLDLSVSLAFKNIGFIVLVTFFCGSIAVDKIKKHSKKTGQNDKSVEKRGDCRDMIQVFSNGGVAFVSAVLYFISSAEVFLVVFAASMAEAFADTVASGLGSFSPRAYDIFRGERCERGISGGMSLIGTASSLIASFVIASVSLLFEGVGLTEFLIIGSVGFAGGIFDSMLGSLLQVKYKCTECGKITEKEKHCGKVTEKYRGLRFVNNDVVNFLSTLFAAAFALLLYFLL